MSDAQKLVFVHAEDVRSRGIIRHDHAIERVVHYHLYTARGVSNLLVHMAADGLIGDYDLTVY